MAGQNNVPPDWTGWKRQLLAKLGAPLTPANDAFLNAWARREGGGGQNNPFNTTYPLPGATNLAGNSAGVKNYPIPDEGAAATYLTLQAPYYTDVVADLRAGKASTTKCYSGLRKWSGGGYCSLAGTATTAPAGGSGVGEVGNPMADQGFGPAYNATPGCHLHTHWEAPTSPFGTTQGIDICWDKTLGSLLIAGGGVLILAGVAVLVVSSFAETRAGQTAAKGLSAAAGPAGAAGRTIAAQRPAQRRARATEAEQQAAAAEARRLAPVRSEERRQAAFTTAEKRRAAAERRRGRQARAAEGRREQLHEQTYTNRESVHFTRQRAAANRGAGLRTGRQLPPRGRSAADDPAPF